MQERASTTRKAVLRAAAEAFETHGLVSTSINDIIRAAGVTKGALYFHFPSKEALAQAVIAEQSNWRDAQDLDGVVGLQRLIDLSFRFADSLRCDVFVRASIRLTLEYGSFATDHAESYTKWIDAVRDGLQSAQDAGELVEGLDLDQCSRLLAGAVTGLQLLSEATTNRQDLLTLMETMWATLIPGMVTPETAPKLRYGSDRPRAASPRATSVRLAR